MPTRFLAAILLSISIATPALRGDDWVVDNVAGLAGGVAAKRQSDARRLNEDEARGAQRWIGDIIDRHHSRRAPPAAPPQSATS